MKTQGWVVVHPDGTPRWWTANCSRTESIRLAAWEKRNLWKQLYRLGYRCVRCEVRHD